MIRQWSASQLRRHALLHIEGLEHIPDDGPVLLVCRHVHHLYDGCVLLGALPRRVHLFIALDWLPTGVARAVVERLCRLVRWPVVLRSPRREDPRHSGDRQKEAGRSVRRSLRSAVDILVQGDVLAIFPEGYPNVDPVYTPKQGLDEVSPFLSGFASIIDLAQARCSQPVPVVPVGFAYARGQRWSIDMRCGPACYRDPGETRESFVASVQSKVMELSRPPAIR